jgi:hypothetical protein
VRFVHGNIYQSSYKRKLSKDNYELTKYSKNFTNTVHLYNNNRINHILMKKWMKTKKKETITSNTTYI